MPEHHINPAHHQPVKGMAFMVVQTLLLALISVLVKKLTEHGQHPVEISFWRSAIMLAPVWFWVKASGKLPLLKTANIKAQISRAVIGTLTMLLMFMTYSYLPLAEAQSLFFTTPLFIVALSWPVLGEKVGPYRALAALAGFSGVLLMLQPGIISSAIGAFFGIASALSMCAVTLLLRTLGRTQDPLVTIYYFALVGAIIMIPPLPFFWKMPTPIEALMLISVSMLAMINQYFLTKALFMAPPSVTSPISYLGLLWALLMDLAIWNVFPATLTLCGAGIVIGANLVILYREHSLKKKQQTQTILP